MLAEVRLVISMVPPASRRTLDDRSGNAIVYGGAHPVSEFNGMCRIKGNAVLTEMKGTSDQAVITFLRIEIEPEEMPPEGFGVDLIDEAQGGCLKAVAGRTLKHEQVHDGLVRKPVCRARA
jgi:hypothetical protein